MQKKESACNSILIVSGSEQFDYLVKKSLVGFLTIDVVRSVALARRHILEKDYDIVTVNMPLSDETGTEFAIDVSERSTASVLIVSPAETYADVMEMVTDHGVMVVVSPSPPMVMEKAIRLLIALQGRIKAMQKKLRTAEEKMEELRTVSKAKLVLVEKKHLTEEEAHKYIGKQAMNHGVSRKRIAEAILDDLT